MSFVLTLEEIPHSRKIGEIYVKGESFFVKENKFFENIFNVEEIVNSQNPPPENLVKIKQVLDLIQSKNTRKLHAPAKL